MCKHFFIHTSQYNFNTLSTTVKLEFDCEKIHTQKIKWKHTDKHNDKLIDTGQLVNFFFILLRD